MPLDECFDRLDEHSDADEFVYECRREKDGGFLLHLTLHQPTQQPLDTLYTLRLDPGRQTVVTLIFIREAFGYKEPLFPQEMLDRIHGSRSWTPTAPNKVLCKCFSFCAVFDILVNAAAQNMRASSSVGQSWRLITARPYRFHLFQTALFRYFLKFQTSKKRFHLLFTYEGSFERPSQVRSNFIRAISLTVKAGGS